ncbi:MAG: glycoside hydrolase family 36 protein [Thermotogota bacterium]|nr:glycoside hydrolase family 36 protein [Thermotogota bacterium]
MKLKFLDMDPFVINTGIVSFEKYYGDLTVQYTLKSSPEETYINTVITNNGTEMVKPGRFNLFNLVDIEGYAYMNSWQSWMPFKAYYVKPDIEPLVSMAKASGNTLYSASIVPDILENGDLPSDYFIAFKDFVAGFLSSKVSHPFFLLNENKKRVEVMIDLFGKPLNPGESIKLEPFVLLEKDPLPVLLERYAQLINNEEGVHFKNFEGIGWCSWYQYFTEIDFNKLMKDIEKISSVKSSNSLPYTLIQLDDGYEKDIGDWLETNDKFPDLSEISENIVNKGLKAGIWVAPFSISETSSIFKEHKDWLVKDFLGKPKLCYRNWNKKIYALDTTHPGATKYLKNLFSKLREVRFSYLKIDFLFAGAMPGKRYNENVTPVEAYREGMKIIKSYAGEDTFILGCGAPLLPSVGFVDAMRIGSDTAPIWNGDVPDIGIPSAKFSIRNAITRYFMHKRLWLNDPDTLILRNEAELTDSEKKLFCIVSASLDNILLHSDEMKKLNEKNVQLLKEAMKYSEGKARVFFGHRADTYVVATKGGRYYNSVIAVNLNDENEKINIPLEAIQWSGVTTEKSIDVDPHSISIRKDNSLAVKLKVTREKMEDGREINYYEPEN